MLAARKSAREILTDWLALRSDVEAVGATPGGWFTINFENESRAHRVPKRRFVNLLGATLASFLEARPGIKLSVDEAAFWGLTEHLGDAVP